MPIRSIKHLIRYFLYSWRRTGEIKHIGWYNVIHVHVQYWSIYSGIVTHLFSDHSLFMSIFVLLHPLISCYRLKHYHKLPVYHMFMLCAIQNVRVCSVAFTGKHLLHIICVITCFPQWMLKRFITQLQSEF